MDAAVFGLIGGKLTSEGLKNKLMLTSQNSNTIRAQYSV
jgi:hypothetical protein